MELASSVNFVLGILSIIAEIAVVFLASSWLFGFKIPEVLRLHALPLAFTAVLIATLGSLTYSEIIGYEPCKLCWIQRILMYPQVILLGMALLKKDYKIADYGLVLAAMGGFFSLYHGYIYYGGSSILPCSASGLAASCAARYVF